MLNTHNLQRKAEEYRRVLENTNAYRKVWRETLAEQIIAALKSTAESCGLSATIERRGQIDNLEAITLSLGNVGSGMVKEVVDGVRRNLIKHNGSLVYQQLFNGKVIVIVQYPFIESYGERHAPKTIAIYRPEELRGPYFERHVEELLTEATKWEDYDDDEPHQKIGFRLNFEKPETVTAPPAAVVLPETVPGPPPVELEPDASEPGIKE